jgi:dienelactone hydrolase
MPRGAGPFSALVVLHGCNGVGPHYRNWARQLAEWGYVALLVDSFRPRNVAEVCNHGMLVPPQLQAQDAFSAAEYLRSRGDIRAERVAVIGFSHGGWAVLKAVWQVWPGQHRRRPSPLRSLSTPAAIRRQRRSRRIL